MFAVGDKRLCSICSCPRFTYVAYHLLMFSPVSRTLNLSAEVGVKIQGVLCESSSAAKNCTPEMTKAVSLPDASPFELVTVIIPPLSLR